MQHSKTLPIESSIVLVRGQRVILASDLARIYGVETRVLNQAVKRNIRGSQTILCSECRPRKARRSRVPQRVSSQISRAGVNGCRSRWTYQGAVPNRAKMGLQGQT